MGYYKIMVYGDERYHVRFMSYIALILYDSVLLIVGAVVGAGVGALLGYLISSRLNRKSEKELRSYIDNRLAYIRKLLNEIKKRNKHKKK